MPCADQHIQPGLTGDDRALGSQVGPYSRFKDLTTCFFDGTGVCERRYTFHFSLLLAFCSSVEIDIYTSAAGPLSCIHLSGNRGSEV